MTRAALSSAIVDFIARRNSIPADSDTGTTKSERRGQAMTLDSNIRAALERHWAASDANDFNAEHQIYRQDAVLEYPQSGERIRGRDRIQASRTAQPNYKRFSVRRIIGAAQYFGDPFQPGPSRSQWVERM